MLQDKQQLHIKNIRLIKKNSEGSLVNYQLSS